MTLTSVDSCRLSLSYLTLSRPTAVWPPALLARTPDLGLDWLRFKVTEDGFFLSFFFLLARWSAA
jgi:hypothetical protein